MKLIKKVKVTTKNEIVELNDFKVIPGQHCESSAMMNALNYQGVKLKESTINGFASSASFGFAADEAFPTLLMRVRDFKENFLEATGILIQVQEPKTPQEAYDSVKNILKKGIPVVLRVNMRYLPYLHGGKYGGKHTSFGWHFITLVKLDEVKDEAWVSDTTFTELQCIKISDVARARNAKEGQFYSDNYSYYFDNPHETKIDYPKAFKKSIIVLLYNIENYEMLKELEKFPNNIINIEKKRSVYVMEPLFYTMYGFIEEFGTGGSGFRNFLRDYLRDMGELFDNKSIKDAAVIVDKACTLWKKLALKFKSISQSVMSLKKDKEARSKMYNEAADIAIKIYQSENDIYNELRALYDKINIINQKL